MGQYYKGVILDENGIPAKFAMSWDFGSGAKLTEHSWLLNPFVQAIERLLFRNPQRVVWAGDYAEPEPTGETIYTMCKDESPEHLPATKQRRVSKRWRYVINHDTKEFIDKWSIPMTGIETDAKGRVTGWQMHPLPLMTCEGNGQGGGDYHLPTDLTKVTECEKRIGSWARALISIDSLKPKGYTKVEFDLKEEW